MTMALMNKIIATRSRAHSDLGSMSDRQLEDLGLCRADLRHSKTKSTPWPTRPNEAWPSS
ncbi:MAG: DUF1127 domain-containing protein [Hyphomicrobiaceae bacterium]